MNTRAVFALRFWPSALVGLALCGLAAVAILNAIVGHPKLLGDADWYATALPALVGDGPLYDPARLGPHPVERPPFWNQPPSLAPFTLLLLLPAWVWGALMAGAFLAGLVVIWPRVGLGGTLILLPLLLLWEPVQSALLWGNINAAVFGLLAVALRFPRSAGWAIGLAAAIKLAPILGVAWLLGKRDWRGAGIALGVLMAFTLIVVVWKGATTMTDFIALRLHEYEPGHDPKISLTTLGLSPMVGYLAGLLLAVVAARTASFSLAVAAMLVSVPFPHSHYWPWLLVPLLGVWLPWALGGKAARRRRRCLAEAEGPWLGTQQGDPEFR